MSLMQKQILSRFKYFNFFWILTFIFWLSNLYPFDRNKLLELDPKLITTLVVAALAYFVFTVCQSVFIGMWTHGIFNYLNSTNRTKIDPTFAVWSIFIPFFNLIRVPMNLIKATTALKIKSTYPKILFGIGTINLLWIFPFVYFYVISINNPTHWFSISKPYLEAFWIVLEGLSITSLWLSVKSITQKIETEANSDLE